MKTKSIVLALMLSVFSVAAFAIDPVGPKVVVVNQKEAGLYKVIYQGDQAGKVSLKIYNDSRELVFSENTYRTSGFIRPVNFTGMAAGEYTIELVDATGKFSQKVKYTYQTVKESKVTASNTSNSVVHVAQLNGEKKYLIAVPENATESIMVRIYDGYNALVHEQKVQVNGTYATVYNLNNVAGKPTFEITDNAGLTKVVRY